MDSASESDKGNQSIFSARSGIQDLLTKPESETEPTISPIAPIESIPDPATAPETPRKKGKAKKSKRQIERVKRRQENYLHQRRVQKRRQVMFSRLRILLKLCFAGVLAVVLWTVVQSPFWVYQTPRFALQNNHLLQPAQIQPFIRPLAGKPIYTLQTGKLAQKIKNRFEIVDRVWVRRQAFPYRLVFLVQEKQPWAEIYASEKHVAPYALLVPHGIVNLKRYPYHSGQYQKPSLEKILIAPHTVLTPDFLHRLQEIAWQSHQIHGLHLNKVDARNVRCIVLHFQEIPVLLGPLNNSANERLGRLIALTPKIAELKNALESVDLRWEEQATFHKKTTAKIVLSEE